MRELHEREFNDSAGHHWECWMYGPDGMKHHGTLIQPKGGWPPGMIDAMRAKVRAKASVKYEP